MLLTIVWTLFGDKIVSDPSIREKRWPIVIGLVQFQDQTLWTTPILYDCAIFLFSLIQIPIYHAERVGNAGRGVEKILRRRPWSVSH